MLNENCEKLKVLYCKIEHGVEIAKLDKMRVQSRKKGHALK